MASAWELPVDSRIEIIANKLGESDFRKQVPGLKTLLDHYLEQKGDVDAVDFYRDLLNVFKKSPDQTYEGLLAKYTADEQHRLETFVDGKKAREVSPGFTMGPSLGAREEMQKLQEATAVNVSAGGPVHVDGLSDDHLKEHHGHFHTFLHELAEMFHHKDKDSVTVYEKAEFQNWGLNIENVPRYTCIPTSVAGIQRVVNYAKQKNLSVRCAGFRHSWSPIFGRNGQILISLLTLRNATHIPNITSLPLPESKPTELETIDVVKDSPVKPLVAENALVRVGCAVTNERLRRWSIKNGKVTIPYNVIMVEITLGGSNAPICHGAGRTNKTLSDLVRQIEYVDANGNLQKVNKVEHLRAAAGCFGLLGVVTHITLEFSPMSYAEMTPHKLPVMQAVPPPPGMKDEDIPKALFVKRSPEERVKDQAEFEERATSNYYCEWFWFPYSDRSWVNCWNKTSNPTNHVQYPDDLHLFLAFIQTFAMNVLQNTPLLGKLISAVHLNEAAVTLISRAAMLALPDKPIKTTLPDAQHFQRAIQNVRVRDMEVEMPLLPKPNKPEEPDYTIVQRAWWDAILTAYKHTKTCPMRMPLELRIMGGSDIILAPQRGNTLGTCSIEVLTLRSESEIWPAFAQEVLDGWMKYEDPATGKKLKTRPHWAKEWEALKVDGRPWAEKLKGEDYKEEIKEFNAVLEDIGKGQGWTRQDLQKRFSNDFLDGFYFDDLRANGLVNGSAKSSQDL